MGGTVGSIPLTNLSGCGMVSLVSLTPERLAGTRPPSAAMDGGTVALPEKTRVPRCLKDSRYFCLSARLTVGSKKVTCVIL